MKNIILYARRISSTLFLLTGCLVFNSVSQPSLNINRIELHGTQVSIWIQAKCADTLRFDISKNNLKLVDNGNEVTDFDFVCIDPNRYYCSSVALVVDRSGSMELGNPSGLDGAKAGCIAFIDAMDTTCDGSTLISFNHQVTVDVPMTNNTSLLKQGVDKFVAGGADDLAGAMCKAEDELVQRSMNNNRVMILMTDGEDHISNPDCDLVRVAQTNGIRIFTVGWGTGVWDDEMRNLADVTGGTYYKLSDANQIKSTMVDIANTIHHGFQECRIDYSIKCPNRYHRKVELSISGLMNCSGSTTQILRYIPPYDTATYITMGAANVQTEQSFPLSVHVDCLKQNYFDACTFSISFDQSRVQFVALDTKGCLLDHVPITATPDSASVIIRTMQSKIIDSSGVLLKLIFKTKQKTGWSEFNFIDWYNDSVCVVPRLDKGLVMIENTTSVERQGVFPSLSILGQNYPNPFTELTIVDCRLTIQQQEKASFEIYDIFGREVLDLSDQMKNGKLTIDNSQLKIPGVYFYRLTIGNQSQTRMMTLIK